MVNFTVQKMEANMERRQMIRNLAVIAHVDHGKSTLTDSLLSKAGFIAEEKAGGKRATDTRKDEQQRGVTIKSTAVSLCYTLEYDLLKEMKEVEGDSLLVNLIDSPGHVDFSSEVTAALRVSDGALVVVDCVSGPAVQTETVLRQALGERIKPVLMMNKLDRCILEKQMDPEDLYRHLRGIIEKVNNIISIYHDGDAALGDMMLSPERGNVSFGAGLHRWGFNLRRMANTYAKTFNVDKEKMMSRLWGDHFVNPQSNQWNTHGGPGYVRGFCKYVLEPIYKVLDLTMKDKKEQLDKFLKRVDIKVSAQEQELVGKEFMRLVMNRWLPVGDAMLDMIALHLPSPQTAQAHRTQHLYEGPLDDEAAIAMKKCDPDGPLMIYVSKMVPSSEKGHFFAVGRVFSGRVNPGDRVSVLGPSYVPGKKDKDYFEIRIQRTVVMMAGVTTPVDGVPCGNVVGLMGIDKYLFKTCTITTYKEAHNMKVLKFMVSPVVKVAVEVVKPSDITKLLDGLKRLALSDPMLQVTSDEGQHIVAGAGELHLEICISDLQEFAGVPLKTSKPVVSYKETVTAESSQVCLAKSANKHNRLFMRSEPLPEQLCKDIDEGLVVAGHDAKELRNKLVNEYGFDKSIAKKLWSFGPHGNGPNLLIDNSRSVANLHEARDLIVAGFQWASQEGPLCSEEMRGVRFNLDDALIHHSQACRGGGQLLPATRRALFASVLTANPRLVEPVYLVDVQCMESNIGAVYKLISRKRGEVFEETNVCGTPLYTMKAYLPVRESFGFSEELKANTSGQALASCSFDHWSTLESDPLEVGSTAYEVVRATRERRGLALDVPGVQNYLDKL